MVGPGSLHCSEVITKMDVFSLVSAKRGPLAGSRGVKGVEIGTGGGGYQTKIAIGFFCDDYF